MKYIDLKLLLLFIFLLILIGKSQSQEFISSDNFNNKIAKDIVAVEFWVDWNSSNEFADLSSLSDCSKYRVDIGKHPDLQKEYNITCIPTVIIFESGDEKERFKANIMFQLDADKKKVQKSIDNIMLAKFN
jgi:thioredoxin-like negative regulator of GroEL|tara:strand:+ start:99 stop:491 length:393 start_codon:yes stop_codon:yes gene_type:complete